MITSGHKVGCTEWWRAVIVTVRSSRPGGLGFWTTSIVSGHRGAESSATSVGSTLFWVVNPEGSDLRLCGFPIVKGQLGRSGFGEVGRETLRGSVKEVPKV